MSNWLPNAAWALFCIWSWLALAHDPITILFCVVVTVPFTAFLVRDYLRQRNSITGD
jgi:hypothetical protein